MKYKREKELVQKTDNERREQENRTIGSIRQEQNFHSLSLLSYILSLIPKSFWFTIERKEIRSTGKSFRFKTKCASSSSHLLSKGDNLLWRKHVCSFTLQLERVNKLLSSSLLSSSSSSSSLPFKDRFQGWKIKESDNDWGINISLIPLLAFPFLCYYNHD